MKDLRISGIDRFSVQERLWIVENIWASIADQSDSIKMPDWHQRELEKRLDSHKNNPEGGSTWAEVKKKNFGINKLLILKEEAEIDIRSCYDSN